MNRIDATHPTVADESLALYLRGFIAPLVPAAAVSLLALLLVVA
jgi:hypothetical protein